MRRMPTLQTEHLTIRPFTLDDHIPFHHISERCFGDGTHADDRVALEAARRMHTWRVLNEEMLARLDQPPYGERAIVLGQTDTLIGAIGIVPYIDAFNVIPSLLSGLGEHTRVPQATAEVGLFWAIDPAHQGQGYATEAARAIINYLFTNMGLGHVIATTEFDNHVSQAVMRKLGMQLHRNETGKPPWLQVVGLLARSS